MWKKRLAIAEIVLIAVLLVIIGVLFIRRQKEEKAGQPASAAVSVSVTGTEAAGEESPEEAVPEAESTGSAGEETEVPVPDTEAESTEALSGSSDDGIPENPEQEEESVSSASESSREEDPYADRPDVDISSWEFLLANYENSIEEYVPETAEIEGIELDYRIIDAMTAFVEDCRAAGNSVVLASGYRDYDTQQYLFQMECTMYDEETAATIVARPGTSEHQTGLAADITDNYYEYKTSDLQYTAMYQWMAEHCQEYGFIVRFPEGKEDITRIIYEPWHFRYVGVEAATYIMEHDLTLEEFIALYQ